MYLFFDTETTGLSSLKDHVVQLAWVLADSAGNIKAEECHVIRPDGYSIPTAAAKIHGITTARACEIGKPLAVVLTRLSDAAGRATIVIAHNLSFDLGILKHDYKIVGLPFPLHGKTQICTMKLSTAWCRLPKLNGATGFKWPKLEELHYRLFGEGFDGAHDALADSHACRRCYFELVKLEVITPPNISEKKKDTQRKDGELAEKIRLQEERKEQARRAEKIHKERTQQEEKELEREREKQKQRAAELSNVRQIAEPIPKEQRPSSFQHTATAPSLTHAGNLNWLWLVAAAIVLIMLVNAGKDEGKPATKTAKIDVPISKPAPTVTPEPIAADDAEQRSARMKKLFESKDYYGVIGEAKLGRYMTRDLNILGIAFYLTGQLNDAIEVFKQAENAFSNEPIVKRNLGDALLANGQSTTALEKYREALAMVPSDQTYRQRVAEAKRAVDLLYLSRTSRNQKGKIT